MTDLRPVREISDGITVSFKVVTRSSSDRLGVICGGNVKLYTTAPPVDNKANSRIVRYLAETFGISPGSVRIVRGETSNRKQIFLPVARKVFEDRLAAEDESS